MLEPMVDEVAAAAELEEQIATATPLLSMLSKGMEEAKKKARAVQNLGARAISHAGCTLFVTYDVASDYPACGSYSRWRWPNWRGRKPGNLTRRTACPSSWRRR